MGKRIPSIIDLKKKIGIAILLIVIIATVIAGMILAFTYYDKGNIIDDFYESVNYDPDKDLLSFTIPKTMPVGYKFYLHISGRMFMGDKSSGMSFHAFDEESQSYTWKSGKTYTYPLNSYNLDFIILDFGLLSEKNKKLLYAYTIHIYPNGAKTINKAY
jgi:hypothetical protein